MYDELERIDAKKSLGQHFLNNQHIPRLMADAAEVGAGDIVVEIGPGTGVLTRELLSRGATVIAIEADARAVEALQEPFKAEILAQKLVISHSDARTLDLHTMPVAPHKYKVVANIPYYLSGRLFRAFLETDVQPNTLVFLVQKEVAERIARDPKESLLSLSVKAFGEPKYVKTVGKGNFTPPPKVDSAIIAVRNITNSRFSEIKQTAFFTILHAGFAAKRKQLIGNLTKTASRDTLTHIFSTLGIPLDARGEDLSIDTWLSIAKAIEENR